MVSGVTFPRYSTNFKKNDKQQNNNVEKNNQTHYVDLPGTKRLNLSPAAIGIINGVCWYGVCSFLSMGVAKICKAPINKTLDRIINASLGGFMGYNAYKTAKSEK